MGSAEEAKVRVELAFSPAAGEVRLIGMVLPAGSSVRDALRCSGICPQVDDDGAATLTVGVWGKLKSLDDALCDRDRVEVYRPLRIDPKEARRRRQRSTCNPKRSRP